MYVTGPNPRRSRQWPNSDDPDNVGQLLGDTTTARESAVIAAWRLQVAMLKPFYKLASGKVAQGQAVVVRMPSGEHRGQLGYKYPSAAQPGNTVSAYTYNAAPANVRAADAAAGAQIDSSKTNWATNIDQGAAESGKILQRLATGTAEAAGAIAGGVAGGASRGLAAGLGIPAWLVPVGLAAAGIFAVKTLAPGLLPFGLGRR